MAGVPRCLFCHKGPPEGVSVHRVNAKGQPGVWACARHIDQTDAEPRDPGFMRLCQVLGGRP